MMYPYITLQDGTEILHSQILGIESNKKIEVHFERPNDNGFDVARCELPSYKWIKREGFLDEEILFFEEFLRNNAHLLFKYAEAGGIKIA